MLQLATHASQSLKFHISCTNAFGVGTGNTSSTGGFGSSSGGTRMKFSGFRLGGSMREDKGMADSQL